MRQFFSDPLFLAIVVGIAHVVALVAVARMGYLMSELRTEKDNSAESTSAVAWGISELVIWPLGGYSMIELTIIWSLHAVLFAATLIGTILIKRRSQRNTPKEE